eukprot:TRINITY_DN14714_c0_g1_i2.p2 TRINITY_DN14714_c0_g1~~TRINITY_DN14714_c0_g1_i2.p2  ORF type:complete len:125 (+),score=37.95 TRINITY_DN14714_c0_g1_i2:77-451(+)
MCIRDRYKPSKDQTQHEANQQEIIYDSVYDDIDNKESNVETLRVRETLKESEFIKKGETLKPSALSAIKSEDVNEETKNEHKEVENVSYQSDLKISSIINNDEIGVEADRKDEGEVIEVKDDPS